MSNKIIIAESGSTKTNWVLLQKGLVLEQLVTPGLNPNYSADHEAFSLLNALPDTWRMADKIYFYGSGIGSAISRGIMQTWLQQAFPHASMELENDLVAAARSLCASRPGIVAILGTGSNACKWDGQRIDEDQHSLGYILGDEGSGFAIGKRFIADYFYNLMPSSTAGAFAQFFPYSRQDVLEATYHQPAPNRFIASAAKFADSHRRDAYVMQVIKSAFLEFIRAYLLRFQLLQLDVYFAGSVASAFPDVLHEAMLESNLQVGEIQSDPLEGLLHYHKTH